MPSGIGANVYLRALCDQYQQVIHRSTALLQAIIGLGFKLCQIDAFTALFSQTIQEIGHKRVH